MYKYENIVVFISPDVKSRGIVTIQEIKVFL
jgi:hypothetical protein